MAPEIEKTYAATKSTNALAFGELFVGMQKSLTSQWLGQLGLAAATTGRAKLQGVYGMMLTLNLIITATFTKYETLA
ncbi:hypothetical protein [Legionella sp.]|uniref:hypothetical protein n=1 Tax=Legionella sp. TaxID=459 RepID=UPI003CA2983A